MTGLSWKMERLDGLKPGDVHDLLSLRAAVFVVEQNCPFLDPDELDQCSWHLLGRDAHEVLVAYLRIVDAARKYPEPSIGRVVTRSDRRGQGLGIRLMQEGIDRTRALWPAYAVRIGAQHRLEAFYQRMGFRSDGAIYIEDNIAHVEMVLASEPRVSTEAFQPIQRR